MELNSKNCAIWKDDIRSDCTIVANNQIVYVPLKKIGDNHITWGNLIDYSKIVSKINNDYDWSNDTLTIKDLSGIKTLLKSGKVNSNNDYSFTFNDDIEDKEIFGTLIAIEQLEDVTTYNGSSNQQDFEFVITLKTGDIGENYSNFSFVRLYDYTSGYAFNYMRIAQYQSGSNFFQGSKDIASSIPKSFMFKRGDKLLFFIYKDMDGILKVFTLIRYIYNDNGQLSGVATPKYFDVKYWKDIDTNNYNGKYFNDFIDTTIEDYAQAQIASNVFVKSQQNAQFIKNLKVSICKYSFKDLMDQGIKSPWEK